MNSAPELSLTHAALPKSIYSSGTETTARPVSNADAAFIRSLHQLVQSFSEQVAVVDEQWTIIAVNEAWCRMIAVAGYPQLTEGTNYQNFLATFALKGHENARAVLNGVAEIDAGKTNSFKLTYAGVDQWEGRTLQLRINRLHFGKRSLAIITRHDITDSAELRRLKETFCSSVMAGQAEERRRFGRELHDSAAQLLTSVGLLLGTLRRSPGTGSPELVREAQELLSEAQKEIRAVSYLAHPPALDRDLCVALRNLARGFARRTGLRISFRKRGKATGLSQAAEIALYRIAQEGLANVHRHARAKRVLVCIVFKKATAHLVISDDGVGISRETLSGAGSAGVGLGGMRSRLAEIGGRLSVRALRPGTAVCASVRTEPTHSLALVMAS